MVTLGVWRGWGTAAERSVRVLVQLPVQLRQIVASHRPPLGCAAAAAAEHPGKRLHVHRQDRRGGVMWRVCLPRTEVDSRADRLQGVEPF